MTLTAAPPEELDPQPPRTVRPAAPVAEAGPDRPRALRSRTFDDWACLAGALAGSLGLTWLMYMYVLPFDGRVGFFVCWYLAFVGLYLAVTALSNPWVVVVDRLASTIVQGGAALVALALASAVLFPFKRGYHALFHANFFTADMSGVRPDAAFDHGGVLHAIIGTLVEIAIAVSVAVPLGIGVAVYLNEVGGKFGRVVRTIVEAMTALPSVVAGLFTYAVVIRELGVPRSGIAAAVAITIMILPIIARASDVVLRVVPGGLREASLALGATRWRTLWSVVLPTARPSLATAVILGIARGIGETSPVLLTSGAATGTNWNPVGGQPMNSLPLQIYGAVRSGEPVFIERGMATACVLLMVVFVLFVLARLVARQRVR